MEEERDGRDLTRVSRRGFIKGVGTGLVGSALLGAVAEEREAEAASGSGGMGPGPVPLTLNINGQSHTLRVEPRTTLLNALRNEPSVNLTGAKLVCDRGSCGACTVMMDGKPIYACMLLAVDAVGHKITTVEGLGRGGEMDPVQAAFVEKDALMCGFCTPGFVVSVRSLLNTNHNPTLEDVKAACAGNICRCGTYPRVYEAALAAAQRMRNGG